MQTKLILAALAALTAAPTTSSALQGHPCPNQRSRFFPGFDQTFGPTRRCKSMVVIFEVGVQIASSACPSGHVSAGPHQECVGDAYLGTMCLDMGVIPVNVSTCRCVPHGPGWLSVSSCECHSAGAGGFLPTAGTFSCP